MNQLQDNSIIKRFVAARIANQAFDNFQDIFLENHLDVSSPESFQNSLPNMEILKHQNNKNEIFICQDQALKSPNLQEISQEHIHIFEGSNCSPSNSKKTLISEVIRQNSGILAYVKAFVSHLNKSTVFRKMTNMKQENFRILSDATYFSEGWELPKENGKKPTKGLFSIFLKYCETKIIQLSKRCPCNSDVVFHPYNLVKILWDVLNLVLSLIWFFLIPLMLVFEEIHNSLASLSLYTSIFMTVDIVISFNTAYFKNGTVERNIKRIANHYLRTRFFYDILTIFPIIMDVIIQMQFRSYQYNKNWPIHFLKFLFYFKIITMQEISRRINERFYLEENFKNILSLFKVFFISILVAHIFACFWYLSAKESSSEKNWLSHYNLKESQWSVQYLYAMYWACVTMMTVGYGDITPQNSVETIVCMVSVILGCSVYAYNISSIGMILQDLNKENATFEHNINIINQYMNRKKINRDLQMRIREYLRFIWKEEHTQNLEDEHKIIGILSNSLKEELLTEAYGDIIKRSPMFYANFTAKFLCKVVSIVKDLKLFPEEKIFTENELDECSVYFIMKGKVEILTESGIQIKELGVGEHFGEIEFFSGQTRKLSAKSKDFTTLLSINRADFIDILINNSDDFEKFCMIQDQILFYRNYLPLKTRCYSCNQIGHLAQECHLIHFLADKEKVVMKHNFYLNQERKAIFPRRTTKKKSLALKKKLEISNIKIRAQIEKEMLIENAEEINSENSSNNSIEINFNQDFNTLNKKTKECHHELSHEESALLIRDIDKESNSFSQLMLDSNKLPSKLLDSKDLASPINNEKASFKEKNAQILFLSALNLDRDKLENSKFPEINRPNTAQELIRTNEEIRKTTNIKNDPINENISRTGLDRNLEKSHENIAVRQITEGTINIPTNKLNPSKSISANSQPTLNNEETMWNSFERIKKYKNYFNYNNYTLLIQKMNQNEFPLSDKSTQKNKILESKLSKYTFFPKEMKQRMPCEIRKKTRKSNKKKDLQTKNIQKPARIKKNTFIISGISLQQKFSDVVRFVMRSPTLKRKLRNAPKGKK